jgi:hypothetical protein
LKVKQDKLSIPILGFALLAQAEQAEINRVDGFFSDIFWNLSIHPFEVIGEACLPKFPDSGIDCEIRASSFTNVYKMIEVDVAVINVKTKSDRKVKKIRFSKIKKIIFNPVSVVKLEA